MVLRGAAASAATPQPQRKDISAHGLGGAVGNTVAQRAAAAAADVSAAAGASPSGAHARSGPMRGRPCRARVVRGWARPLVGVERLARVPGHCRPKPTAGTPAQMRAGADPSPPPRISPSPSANLTACLTANLTANLTEPQVRLNGHDLLHESRHRHQLEPQRTLKSDSPATTRVAVASRSGNSTSEPQ